MKRAVLIAAFVLVIASCGGSDDSAVTTTSSTAPAETTATSDGSTTTESTTSTTVESTTTTTMPATTTTLDVVPLEQPAIWPAPDEVFTSPEAAAEDFVSSVLGVPPALGEFQQGDSRSGEIEVFSLPEPGGVAVVRGVLLMRQLGPDDGWFVLGAVNEFNTITSPESMAQVAAGPITVAGSARGFEGAIVVEAFVAGSPVLLDQQFTQAGSQAEPAPYSVMLDLTGAPSGQTVLLIVRGGTGLETDPGEFSAIPVVVS
ncbi:MAG: hypothetical protein HKN03_13165 [Acidimicrobiales bacterium]|nr:hypothetical protein [Acidimicrobiales bacterium]